MPMTDNEQWQLYCRDPGFQQYVSVCRNFDPMGFERALKADETSGSFEFRQVITEAYVEDTAVSSNQASSPLSLGEIASSNDASLHPNFSPRNTMLLARRCR